MADTPMRREYLRFRLDEAEIDRDPIRQFQAWFDELLAAGPMEPNAMTLATSTRDGRPSARIVLLKAFSDAGFTFHSNYNGRKGHELESNPRAALLFYWPDFERQVRIEGRVERLSAQESDAYFAGRPLGAKLGAWTSAQSEVVADRPALESRLREVEARFADGQIPRPPHWGGYRLIPDTFEFWQGRANRLHDRIRYRRVDGQGWVVERLAP